ncbi:MAG: plastocyanin/azurin family copper-binding protein [Acidobacteriota bacterium]
MKRVPVVVVALLAAVVFVARPMAQTAPKPAPAAAGAAGRLIEIDATDQMKFSVVTITAKPGELLHVRLKGVGTMPKMASSHNFVLLNAGADATAFVNDAVMASATAYIPASKKAQVLAHTPTMVGGGETADVTFKAPAKAGSYTYLCSFPGHFLAGMKGTLTVK